MKCKSKISILKTEILNSDITVLLLKFKKKSIKTYQNGEFFAQVDYSKTE